MLSAGERLRAQTSRGLYVTVKDESTRDAGRLAHNLTWPPARVFSSLAVLRCGAGWVLLGS